MVVSKKGTILIVSGPKHDPERKHLHVVCTDPDHNGNVLLVSVCSVGPAYHDPACILKNHEHRFLKHDSFVDYAKASVSSIVSLTNGIAIKKMTVHDEMNGQSFLRIIKGLCASKHTPPKIKKYAGCPPPIAKI